MRKILVLLLFFTVWGFFINTAEAARFGGGRSFGMQRSIGNFSRYQQPSQAQAPRASRSSWAAPLAGLALGSMLGYLFMGHGFSSGILSWLAILSIGFMLWNFLRGKLQMAQNIQASQTGRARLFDAEPLSSGTNAYANEAFQRSRYPADFDAEGFLREAKVQFIRLQAAYDARDLGDLREFTGAEVFAEIQLQLQERGQESNYTEVVSVNAELQDLNVENQSTIASVKFKGLIKEAVQAQAAPFEEFWHFRKEVFRDKWIVVGIQQS